MKHFAFFTLLLSLFLCVAIPLVTADEPLIITPYVDGAEYEASASQEVIIRAGWGACNRGLTQAFRRATSISMEIDYDGESYLVLEPPNRDFWGAPQPADLNDSACIMVSNGGFTTEWLYSLGALDPGTYDLHFLWALDHPLPDGGDYDEDGRPDLFDGIIEETHTIIYVVD